VAAALVHEAIHSLVDVSELRGRLVPPGTRHEQKIASPWTGASISLQSLLDAYFVWYGLMHYWVRAADRKGVDANVCAKYVETCIRGFAPEFDAVVGEQALQAVHPFTRQSITSLRKSVNLGPKKS
jgi:hypothetical protein